MGLETSLVSASPRQADDSESCVGGGRPSLRSVDSEIKGCVTEPRICRSGGTAVPDPVGRRECRVVDGELEPRRGHRASPACHRETT